MACIVYNIMWVCIVCNIMSACIVCNIMSACIVCNIIMSDTSQLVLSLSLVQNKFTHLFFENMYSVACSISSFIL